jgi:hypothetical protein
VQGDDGHPGFQGGGPKKNNKKWRAEKEERRHKGSQTPKKNLVIAVGLLRVGGVQHQPDGDEDKAGSERHLGSIF